MFSVSQTATLKRILRPRCYNVITWNEVTRLFKVLGTDVHPIKNERLRMIRNGVPAIFHIASKPQIVSDEAIKSLRYFLIMTGGVDYEV